MTYEFVSLDRVVIHFMSNEKKQSNLNTLHGYDGNVILTHNCLKTSGILVHSNPLTHRIKCRILGKLHIEFQFK